MISGSRGSSPRSLSAFWKFLPDTLEELTVSRLKREESDEILCALQNHDFGFRDTLTKIKMGRSQLNERDLERPLFEILPWLPNMHTLNLDYNSIKSTATAVSKQFRVMKDSHGVNPTGVGRWSWMRVRGKHNQFTHFVSCYRLVPGSSGTGGA